MEHEDGNNVATEEKSIAIELLVQQKRIIRYQCVIICVLIALLAATNIYHIYQWSQYDTIVVDSGQGGNAGYVGNDGDVNNYGSDSSAQTTEK